MLWQTWKKAGSSIEIDPEQAQIVREIYARVIRKRKVAGYARVSTDSDEQFTSYEEQVDYYARYIQSHPEWGFVKVYTDEGISGTDTRHREGFNEMIEDALTGKIDIAVAESAYKEYVDSGRKSTPVQDFWRELDEEV